MSRRFMSGAVGEGAALVSIHPGGLNVERAREALAACKGVDEAKDIRDKALAVKVYLRTKGAALEAQQDAAEIGLFAERRMGEMLRETPLSKGGRPAKTGSLGEPVLSLEDVGITKKQSHVAQKLAALPERDFSNRIRGVRDAAERLTAAAVLGKPMGAKPPSLQTRRTPAWLFQALDRRFGPFKLDAYADEDNALCPDFLTREQDGNTRPWVDQTFANPEFEDMDTPMRKALAEADHGRRSVMISPVGCAQAWYHEVAIHGTVYVPDTRIHFDLPDGTPTNRADRDTIVVAFGREHANKHWKRGIFRVQRLEVKHLEPKQE